MDLYGNHDLNENYGDLDSRLEAALNEMGAGDNTAADAVNFLDNLGTEEDEQQHGSPSQRRNGEAVGVAVAGAGGGALGVADEGARGGAVEGDHHRDLNGNETSVKQRGRGTGGKGTIMQMRRAYEDTSVGIRVISSPVVDPEEAGRFIPDTTDSRRGFSSFAPGPHPAGARRESIWSLNSGQGGQFNTSQQSSWGDQDHHMSTSSQYPISLTIQPIPIDDNSQHLPLNLQYLPLNSQALSMNVNTQAHAMNMSTEPLPSIGTSQALHRNVQTQALPRNVSTSSQQVWVQE
jgi:hypothetical protein